MVDAEQVIIRINDSTAQSFSEIPFSTEELQQVFIRAGGTPITPHIVRKLEEKISREGYQITSSLHDIYQVAKEMLLSSARPLSLSGTRNDDSLSTSAYQSSTESVLNREDQDISVSSGPSVLSYFYSSSDEIQTVKSLAEKEGMVPILWNSAAGFQCEHLSRHFPLPEQEELLDCRSSEDAFRTIIKHPRSSVAYIFEDVHHFIGEKTNIGPGFGAIRSQIKQLYRSLQGRHEKVYFFIPSSYEMPPELTGIIQEHDKNGRTPKRTLDMYGVELTSAEYIKNINPVIGMEKVLEKIIQTLTRMESNNPLLIGYPGVGKTAAAEGIALKLSNNDVPSNLKGRILYSLSLTSLVAGTRYRGEMEARLEGLLNEVGRCKEHVILFIDEIHGLLDAGMAEGGFGIGDILKPVLARGSFPLIGATTFEGAKHLGRDPALDRRFNTIIIDEPTTAQTIKILAGVRPRFEKHHGVKIDDSALAAAVNLSERSNANQHLPGRAIAVLDSACAYCRIKRKSMVHELDIIRETKN